MVPVLVNTAEPMTRIRIVTVRDESEKTLKVLQRIGGLHVEESKELRAADKTAIDRERREVNDLFTFISKVLGYLPQQKSINLEGDIEVVYTRSFSEISDEVKQIYNKTSRIQEKIENINDELILISSTRKYLEPLSNQTNLRLRDCYYTGKYLFSRVIVVPEDSYNSLQESLKEFVTESIVISVENEKVIHAVADTRHIETITRIVNSAGGRILNIPHDDITLMEYLEKNISRIESYEKEKTKLTDELKTIIGEDITKLVLLREALSAEYDRLIVLEKAGEAKYVTLIEGWIPENIVETAIAEIKENIDYVFVDTRKPEKDEEPPTKYRNPRGFKPFQIIVNLFSVPKYRDWDPTPIISYSFAFFFGLMVCDVLYALGLILLVKYVLRNFVDDPESDNFKQFQRLLYTCCAVALIGGLITGQYFGNIYTFFGIENLALIKSVSEALANPLSFIIIALAIGFIHVNIGHILAFIIAIKTRNNGIILGRLGLFFVQVGLPTIVHSMLGLNIPGFTEGIYSILMYILYGGVVLCIISSLMVNKGLGAILWLFDITGFLGDVMSYARLAGVGLSTYYLAYTFNMMAGMFTDMLGGVTGSIIGFILAIVVLAFGHIINMVLTSITGFMHSMRLCFVEFLFKFYEGGGTEYNPFKLKKRKTVSVTNKL